MEWGQQASQRKAAPTTPNVPAEGEEADIALVTTKLEQLAGQIQEVEHSVSLLGTPKDSEALRDKLEKERAILRGICRNVEAIFKRLKENSRVISKLRTQFDDLQKTGVALIASSQRREREIGRPMSLDLGPEIPDVEASLDDGGGMGDDGDEEGEHQLQMQETKPKKKGFHRGPKVLKDGDFEVTFSTAAEIELQLAEEKKAGIESMETDLEELHDLYQDVSTLVTTQQEDIDKVDSNVQIALKATEEGVNMLEQAVELKKSGDKKRNIIICILVILLIIVASGVTIGVVVSKKAKDTVSK